MTCFVFLIRLISIHLLKWDIIIWFLTVFKLGHDALLLKIWVQVIVLLYQAA